MVKLCVEIWVGEPLSAGRSGADVGWGESRLFWMKGEWSGAREGGRVGTLINDVKRGQAVMGRKRLADSTKSGIMIMIGERPLALLCLSYSNSFLDTD